MKTIHKYELPTSHTEDCFISLPQGAKPLSVAKQGENDDVFLWALIDTDAGKETKKLFCLYTGWDISDVVADMNFLGTVLVNDDQIVLHYFLEA